ncbi:MAG: hypothetical protein J0M25_00740 [Flavobacteriales bacterium]|nr:hypothetical protein [Flavobacteriales bacterium]
MITNHEPSNTLLITKVAIIDFKKVVYTLQSVLQKKDISFDDDEALIILPLLEDVRFPSSTKITDAGTVWNYKVGININNQHPTTVEQVLAYLNKKVIAVLYTQNEKIIIGCNEQPLSFLPEEDNTVRGDQFHGLSVSLSGNTYYNKVVY